MVEVRQSCSLAAGCLFLRDISKPPRMARSGLNERATPEHVADLPGSRVQAGKTVGSRDAAASLQGCIHGES